MLERAGIVTICIFRSTPQVIQKYAKSSLNDQSLALSDKKGFVYKNFHLKGTGAVRGFIGLSWEIVKGIRKYHRYINISGAAKDVVNGNISKMGHLPADFLIDEEGMIVDLFRATTIADQMTFDRIEAFIPEERRCKCYKVDCITPRCREKNAEIKKADSALLFTG